jgi:glycolate oxidase
VTDTAVSLTARLRDALGVDAASSVVSVDDAVRDATREDRSGHRSDAPPVVVVTARHTADVQAALRVASELGVPVVPRGAGTGLAGGAVGGAGELVLSTLGMTELLEVAVDDELAVVQPGIVNAELNRLLEPHGLFWAPDPASRAISTVGGNVATNAGGLLCTKYGVTRDAVLGVEFVTPDGEVHRFGHRTVKGVTGYDLTALVVGSEGTLGVVTEITVKLTPAPVGGVATIGATFPDVEAAAAAASAITAARLRPAIMELVDRVALDAIAAHLAIDLGASGSHLLVHFDAVAPDPGGDANARRALELVRAHGGAAELTTDPAESERLFAIRRAAHPSFAALGEVLIEDVAVPRSRLPEMFAAVARIGARYGLSIPVVAHAGDGNLHPNFVLLPGTPAGHVPDEVWEAASELFRAALALGGTLTGEHGVGLLKRRWLRDELGDAQYALQQRVKAAFDPQGLMNPGKVFG